MTVSISKTTEARDLPGIIRQVASIRAIRDFCFSRDDKQLFFSSNIGEYFRIWSVPSGGGFPREVTLMDTGDVMGLELSPDGSRIAFMVDYGGAEDMDLMVVSADGGRPVLLTEKLKAMPSFTWSPDSRHLAVICESDHRYNIVIVDSATGEHRWATNTDDMKMDLDWSPDGRLIVFSSYREPLTCHICTLEIKTGQIRVVSSMLEGENTGPRFCPAGKALGFTSSARGSKNVVLMNLETDTAIWMPQDDGEQVFLRWNPKGNHFAYLSNRAGEMSIHESNYPPSTTRRLTTTGFFGSDVRYGNATDQVAIRLMTPTQPPEIFIRRHKTMRKLTECSPHGLKAEQFTPPRDVSFKSFDGREIHGFYYTPGGVTDYPVLIWIHGGPSDQHLKRWDPFIQLFLQAGIGVMAPNVRGSSGYGQKFEDLNYRDWGGGDLEDIMAAVDFVRQDPDARGDSLVVGGGSYGGYLTMMAVTRYPDVWTGGINMMGPVNLETFYLNSASWTKPILENKYGFKPPGEDPTFYYNRSPINFADRIQCPMLLIYGRNDPRIPIGEMYQLRKALHDGGKVFEEDVLEGEGHGLNRNDSRFNSFARMIAFIQKYVMNS